MFYSETLLQKTGPLARVWLSANLERKLSKTHILQSNLTDSVDAIITPNQAPMALRLSGQLLLGVVRIYSRKARYLLDDCNEALLKIKMAFRTTGNNDLPENLGVANREALMIPDRITPADNLNTLPAFTMPNADFLLSQMDEVDATPSSTNFGKARSRPSNNRDINLQEDYNNSQFLQTDNFDDNGLDLVPVDDDLELELDFGMDIDERPKHLDRSIEMGRDAPAARSIEDDMISEMDFPRAKGADAEPSLALDLGDGVMIADGDGDIMMDGDDFQFDIGDQSAMPNMAGARDATRARISESPLSDIDENVTRDLEEWKRLNNHSIYEPGQEAEDVEPAPQKKSKKKKVFALDAATQLTSAHIKEQQQSHDNILKEPSFISRDPYLLALLEMKHNGGFVSSIMGDGRSKAWAPELRGLLSLEALHSTNELKRKRDSGIADISDNENTTSKSPRLELGDDDDDTLTGPAGGLGDRTAGPDGTMLEIPADDGVVMNDDDGFADGTALPAFDDTTVPIVHPADSGPVSVGTKHAVHILRDLFGAEAAQSEEKRKKTAVVFQELLPEGRTTKADATKMFFECLVLATKDAIKVEQKEGSLGGPIKVRGKRGLWGAWAEREAGGEIANQDEESRPEPTIASASQTVAAAA
ncbi:Rec8 like protein-domain-containing protein [Microdochium trichocladiopsis]|uniref:Rec8 like protein-domain-containing protein n=1 Tax=Microdochium trichocladiopsis TaxID=1682393 RepID=A0A9P9BRJ6_9PEZI|nr:Rec8 like protein-domain-containing protein [Microdochium trichocladiopsis]KAH7027340.1 Rec8 like protein-domain-containing protein [Microdochium trichocladiopsis]